MCYSIVVYHRYFNWSCVGRAAAKAMPSVAFRVPARALRSTFGYIIVY